MVIESDSFILPSQLSHDVAGRLKAAGAVESVELHWKGESIDGGREFARTLLSLKKRGVKITHEFSIRLDFPRSISRAQTLEIVEAMPRPRNGSVKVRVHVAKPEGTSGAAAAS